MIKQLEQHLINKIAAGEVVERPLSVVKELTENAIDAGASVITVEIKDGGLSLIRVTDNGSGIPPEQVMLAFAQHATSKISDIDDLSRIATLGFRGEALASIAAVSQAEMVTKTTGALSGTRAELHGGTLISRGEIGCTEGTSINISNLFFNTPARLKFLRKPATEAGYVTDLMQRLALGYPQLSFRYISNGQTLVSTSGNGDLQTAIYHIYGRDTARGLIAAEGIISGYIGKPETARGSRAAENFFINNRYVKSDTLQNAVEDAYTLPQGRFPLCVLHLQIPPEQVDVNVHPSKMEVRFANERSIYEQVNEAVARALSSQELIPSFKAASKPKPRQREEAEPIALQEEYTPRLKMPEMPKMPAEAAPLPQHHYRLLGQIWGTYWLALREDELLLIDQHAAHERVLYEELLNRLANETHHAQPLLVPREIELSPREIEIAKENESWLSDYGFEFEVRGSCLVMLTNSIHLKKPADHAFFSELLEKLEKGGENSPAAIIREEVAMAACKSAVKAGDKIDQTEARGLIMKMLALENPFSCPHGRPTVIKLSKREIERMFKRS